VDELVVDDDELPHAAMATAAIAATARARLRLVVSFSTLLSYRERDGLIEPFGVTDD
jgi:hypothetical protein